MNGHQSSVRTDTYSVSKRGTQETRADSLHESHNWAHQCVIHVGDIIREYWQRRLDISEPQVNIHRHLLRRVSAQIRGGPQRRLRELALPGYPIQRRVPKRSRYTVRNFLENLVKLQTVVRVLRELDIQDCVDLAGRDPRDGSLVRGGGAFEVVDVHAVDPNTGLRNVMSPSSSRQSRTKAYHPGPVSILQVHLRGPPYTLRLVQTH